MRNRFGNLNKRKPYQGKTSPMGNHDRNLNKRKPHHEKTSPRGNLSDENTHEEETRVAPARQNPFKQMGFPVRPFATISLGSYA